MPHVPNAFIRPMRNELSREFVRGTITTGIITALQNQNGQCVLNRNTARVALQGGSALAAGVAASRAWQNGQPIQALASIAIGAGAVYALEKMLPQTAAPCSPILSVNEE